MVGMLDEVSLHVRANFFGGKERGPVLTRTVT